MTRALEKAATEPEEWDWFANPERDLPILEALTDLLPGIGLHYDFWDKLEEAIPVGKVRRAWADFLGQKPEAGVVGSPLTLYVHVPLCTSVCNFCMYPRKALERSMQREAYLRGLFAEVDALSRVFADATFSASYVGGGTPSILSAEQIARFLGRLRERFRIDPAGQHTYECNPATTTPEKLRVLHEHGVNRVSLGVQSLVQEVLEAIARKQSVDSALRAIDAAMEVGFHTVNVDLVLGLKGDTLEGFAHSLERVLKRGPDHITLYSFQPLGGGAEPDELDMDLVRQMLETRHELARAYGYVIPEWEEIGKKPDGNPLKNELQWSVYKAGHERPEKTYHQKGAAVLGLGPGSDSNVPGRLHYSQPFRKKGEKSRSPYKGVELTEYDEIIRLAFTKLHLRWLDVGQFVSKQFGRRGFRMLTDRQVLLTRLGKMKRCETGYAFDFRSHRERLVYSKFFFRREVLEKLRQLYLLRPSFVLSWPESRTPCPTVRFEVFFGSDDSVCFRRHGDICIAYQLGDEQAGASDRKTVEMDACLQAVERVFDEVVVQTDASLNSLIEDHFVPILRRQPEIVHFKTKVVL